MFRYALVIGSLLISTSALSDDGKKVGVYVTGDNLTNDCRSFLNTRRVGRGTPHEVQEAARCYGYVTGMLDILEELGLKKLGLSFCIPEGTNANSLTEIVAKFADENPEERNQSGAGLASEAWAKSFPCQSH